MFKMGHGDSTNLEISWKHILKFALLAASTFLCLLLALHWFRIHYVIRVRVGSYAYVTVKFILHNSSNKRNSYATSCNRSVIRGLAMREQKEFAQAASMHHHKDIIQKNVGLNMTLRRKEHEERLLRSIWQPANYRKTYYRTEPPPSLIIIQLFLL